MITDIKTSVKTDCCGDDYDVMKIMGHTVLLQIFFINIIPSTNLSCIILYLHNSIISNLTTTKKSQHRHALNLSLKLCEIFL